MEKKKIMSSTNVVVLTGRLGKDPEVRSTGSGKSVVVFSIAVDDGFGDKKKTDWWDVEAWNKTAEAIGRLVVAGNRVTVTGSLKKDEWQDQSGNKRSKAKILATRVDIIDFAQGSNQAVEISDEDIPF